MMRPVIVMIALRQVLRPWRITVTLLGFLYSPIASVRANDESFETSIRPLLTQYCLGCHSSEANQGELDLERFHSMAEIRRDVTVWQEVLRQLTDGEMPPEDEPQLSAEEQERLIAWVRSTLDEIALASAGDPGPVVLRRLSNHEYTYTIRDLTGVPTLDPVREFPVDGAAGEGFTNVGSALVMSPSLLTKYLDAAKEIADHAVLLPDRITFSTTTSRANWTQERLAAIRQMYATYAVPGDQIEHNLQGVEFSMADGSVIPVLRYLQALDSGDIGGLSPRYIAALADMLEDSEPSVLLDPIRRRWRHRQPHDIPAIAEQIAQWQQSLWHFAKVGHIGKRDGPTAWQSPIAPIVTRQRVALTMPEAVEGMTSLYLVAGDAGDGYEGDVVVWKNPVLVLKSGATIGLSLTPSWLASPDDEPTGDMTDIEQTAPSILEYAFPSELVDGATLRASVELADARGSGSNGSVQAYVSLERPAEPLALVPGRLIPAAEASSESDATWTDGEASFVSDRPILVRKGSEAQARIAEDVAEFQSLFPAALCYHRIVPVDEVVTLTLRYREDHYLQRLMLDDGQRALLDRLWDEMQFVSRQPLQQVDAYNQLWQFATQDADPSAFEQMRDPIMQAADAFEQRLRDVEPVQLNAIIEFASEAWRRPLDDAERGELVELYGRLRAGELGHELSIRQLIARILVSPAFLYRGEAASSGGESTAVNDWELATRLSYFLWSSAPDAELRELAARGRLRDGEVLTAQIRRMLRDDKIRRLATEFGCQWLHVRNLEALDEKSERHFPTFAGLRGDMQEEVVRFFIDLFQQDRSILSLLGADHTFVNGPLAEHYDMVLEDSSWQRVDGMRAIGRGGILGFAGTLATQSGASRTSPILRGNWVNESLLGERLPRPPKDVPILPDEPPQGLSERQLIERHSGVAQCARCHERIDPFGFALEGFDAIGRARPGTDTTAALADGTRLHGLGGLRSYLMEERREDFLRQFCGKLLGYALGRSIQLSDDPLLTQMLSELDDNDCRIEGAVVRIVLSPQFQRVRGSDQALSSPIEVNLESDQ